MAADALYMRYLREIFVLSKLFKTFFKFIKKCVDTIYLFRYNNFCTAEEHKVRTERMLSKGNVTAVPETGILPDGKQKRIDLFRKINRCFSFAKTPGEVSKWS